MKGVRRRIGLGQRRLGAGSAKASQMKAEWPEGACATGLVETDTQGGECTKRQAQGDLHQETADAIIAP